jgi:hypothetical protein
MKNDFVQRECSRRSFCFQAFGASALALLSFTGCSTFNGKKKNKDHAGQFEEDDEPDLDDGQSIFDSERKKQNELSAFVAQNGRKSKSKTSTVRPGDDFLLSDKAKEIYANTER